MEEPHPKQNSDEREKEYKRHICMYVAEWFQQINPNPSLIFDPLPIYIYNSINVYTYLLFNITFYTIKQCYV